MKAGNREVFSWPTRLKCREFIRTNNGKLNGEKLRLVPPNT